MALRGSVPASAKELPMMKLPALALDIVQGILEGDALVGFRADITRHGVLDRLEIKEIQRIFQRGNELPISSTMTTSPR